MPIPPLAQFEWLPMDTWIVVVGALAAMSCALLGNFLVLRKLSMMGDAISHAVLPGLAAAFLLSGSRDSVVMLAGACAVGLLTAVLVEWVRGAGQVDEGASMGVVFTVLFALGLILIRRSADHVDLDPDCVLYGEIVLAALDTRTLLGVEIPRAALVSGGALLVNLLFVLLLFKELRIAAFDPALATTLGFNARRLHYLLMALVAVTTVTAFESVGSILVIAMLVAPAAAAHLLTDRLGLMIVLSLLIAAASAVGGHAAAVVAPGWFGYEGVSTSTAGMMSVVAGLLFLGAALAGPRHGLVSKLLHRAALSARIVREDVLGILYRMQEAPVSARALAGSGPQALRAALGVGVLPIRGALRRLAREGLIQRADAGYELTPSGVEAARGLVRSHRLWELYLERHLRVPADHLHGSAEQLEHISDEEMTERLASSLGEPREDPHGRSIPPATR